MKKNSILIAMTAVIALTVVSGIVQGTLRNRWGQSEALRKAAARIEAMPEQIGDWTMRASEALPQRTVEILECAGNVVRRYENAKTGESVSVTVIAGPAGPTAVHTPEVCLSSRAYERSEDRHVVTLKDAAGTAHDFWTLAFKSTDLGGGTLRVMYAWNDGARWQAPADARFAFAGRPYLYKIQLTSESASTGGASEQEPCRKFLGDLLAAHGNWPAEGARDK